MQWSGVTVPIILVWISISLCSLCIFCPWKIQGQTLKILEKIFNGKTRKDSLEFTFEDRTKVRVAFTLEYQPGICNKVKETLFPWKWQIHPWITLQNNSIWLGLTQKIWTHWKYLTLCASCMNTTQKCINNDCPDGDSNQGLDDYRSDALSTKLHRHLGNLSKSLMFIGKHWAVNIERRQLHREFSCLVI